MSEATHRVRLAAAQVAFPASCAGCDGPGEVTYRLTAERGIELWVMSWHSWVELPLPVCRRCRWRRRLAAAGLLAGMLAALAAMFIVAGLLTGDSIPTGAAVVMIVISFGVVLLYRWRAGKLLDWRILGLRARLLQGEGAPVELCFRRPGYFIRWAELNRAAAAEAAVH